MANEEPEVAYDHKYIAAKAESKDGGYAISGTKIFVPYADIVDKVLVSVRTSGNPGDEKGITIMMVDPKTDGVTLSPMPILGGERQFKMELDNVSVSIFDIEQKLGGGCR